MQFTMYVINLLLRPDRQWKRKKHYPPVVKLADNVKRLFYSIPSYRKIYLVRKLPAVV